MVLNTCHEISNFDVIGEINFGDNKGIKSTDFMAGVQYTIKIAENFDLSFSPAGPGQFLPASPICFAHKKVDSSAGRKPSSPSFAGMCFGMPPS